MMPAEKGTPPWIERAASLVRYHEEARRFITRASAKLPADAEDTEAVCLLWQQADGIDRQVSEHFSAMNEGLLEGRGQLDVTRGADMSRRFGPESMLVYQCTWAFQWDDRGISVVLAIEPRSKHLIAWIAASGSEVTQLSVPPDDGGLEDALGIAYFRAATRSQES
jgi:hypothetical protein